MRLLNARCMCNNAGEALPDGPDEDAFAFQDTLLWAIDTLGFHLSAKLSHFDFTNVSTSTYFLELHGIMGEVNVTIVTVGERPHQVFGRVRHCPEPSNSLMSSLRGAVNRQLQVKVCSCTRDQTCSPLLLPFSHGHRSRMLQTATSSLDLAIPVSWSSL